MKRSISTLSRPLALTAVTALTCTLVGCGSSEEPVTAPEPAASTSSSAPPVEPSVTASPSASGPATASSSASPSTNSTGNDVLLAAGRLGQQEVSSSKVISIESERNGYEVHVVTGGGAEQQLRIDTAGKTVVSGPTDDRPDAEDRNENERFAQAEMDYREAVKAVEGAIDGGKVNELSLDRDNGRTLWEADVTAGSQQRSVQIDADSGRVVSNRVDD